MIIVCGSASANHAATAHPLDPLSRTELISVRDLLTRTGLADATTRFPLIRLDEPEKAAVLGWRPGESADRKAVVIARRAGTTYQGLIDLASGRVEHWDPSPAAEASVFGTDWSEARRIVMADKGWRNAMARRGYVTYEHVFCAVLPFGGDTDAGPASPRLARVTCFDRQGTRNIRARPIEGLVATVDLDQGRVLDLLDTGVVPLSPESGDFGQTPMPQRRGHIKQPKFSVLGHLVRWRDWSFRYRMDPRAGLILSLVQIRDQEQERQVLYRGSIAEMFVPYMDPDPNWSFRAALDVADFGFGNSASPLVPGVDCPTDATMLDAIMADDRGHPVTARSIICLFERDTSAPLWRHAEAITGSYAGRPAHELVMRTIPSVGTYDYIIDWVLTESGGIRVDVGATGIDAAKGVATNRMTDASMARDTAHGTLVAPNLVAVFHDHFLLLRLDFDIDGQRNTLVRQRFVALPAPEGRGARAMWSLEEENISDEGPVRSSVHEDAEESWRMINPNRANRLGQNPGYELHTGHSALTVLPKDRPAPLAGAFSTAPLWLTAYDRGELYAMDSLASQTQDENSRSILVGRGRPVENADIVLWYTMGFHHLTRPEDWPVLPTVWHSVEFVPSGFFDRNPSLPRAP